MNTNRDVWIDQPAASARRGRLRLAGWWLLAAVGLSAMTTSVCCVDETEFVLVEQLGRIVAVYDCPADRGLKFKLPWPISTTRRFDSRVQLFDPPGRELHTKGRKNITVDAYVCWRIAQTDQASPPPRLDRPVVHFFQSLGSRAAAEHKLASALESAVGNRLVQVELSELMSADDSQEPPAADQHGMLEQISSDLLQTVRDWLDEQREGSGLGIQVVDVRIKRINFPIGNQQEIFERMKSERRKIADAYRAEGEAVSVRIRSEADARHKKILAQANADAQRIRGQGEAQAIAILNEAHARDPEFYRVFRTLESYRKIINERTTLVLSASSSLLKLLTEGVPDIGQPPDRPPSTSPGQTPTGRDAGGNGKDDR